MDGPGGSGDVINIRARASYRPDYKRLASALVRAAREKLGMDHAQFAVYLCDLLDWDVTPETIESWENGSIPPADVLLACAVAAQDMPSDVLQFPLTADAERTAALLSGIVPALDQASDPAERVLPYADRGLITRQQWNDIIRGSRDQLWLYGMAEFGYASDDEVPDILGEAASCGCQVRVLLLDPEYPGTEAIDADEGSPPGTLVARIKASLSRFNKMREAVGPQMEIRTYNTHPTVSVVRGDSHMLVTPYLRFSLGSNSPTFELTEGSAGKMFGRYARHFAHMWKLAGGAT